MHSRFKRKTLKKCCVNGISREELVMLYTYHMLTLCHTMQCFLFFLIALMVYFTVVCVVATGTQTVVKNFYIIGCNVVCLPEVSIPIITNNVFIYF